MDKPDQQQQPVGAGLFTPPEDYPTVRSTDDADQEQPQPTDSEGGEPE